MGKQDLIKFEGYIPCVHEDISLSRSDEDIKCDIEAEWELDNDCSIQCPDYQARPIEVCKKHYREFVGECDDCFGDYWRTDREWRREAFLRDKLHLRLRYGKFDSIGWVLNMKPKLHTTWQSDVNGKKRYKGIEITALKRCLEIGVYY